MSLVDPAKNAQLLIDAYACVPETSSRAIAVIMMTCPVKMDVADVRTMPVPAGVDPFIWRLYILCVFQNTAVEWNDAETKITIRDTRAAHNILLSDQVYTNYDMHTCLYMLLRKLTMYGMRPVLNSLGEHCTIDIIVKKLPFWAYSTIADLQNIQESQFTRVCSDAVA